MMTVNMHVQLGDATTTTTVPVAAVGAQSMMPPTVIDDRSARRPWVRPVLIVGLLLVIAVIAFMMFGAKKVADAPPAATIPTVTVVVPGTSEVSDSVTATGSIAARRDSLVGINGEGGLVTAVLVEAGQYVKKGQLLARIDSSVQAQQVASMAAGIKSAKADAALAQSNLDRAVKLVDKGFISKADIDLKTATRDGSNAKVAVAQAQLGEMQARMARLDVRAPSSGLILSRSVETGQIVGSGANNLFRIAEDGILEMRALVAEQDMAKLKVGLPATVKPVGSPNEYHGKIWLLDPVIDNLSRQGVARIALAAAPGLRVGAFANATIAGAAARQPVLPQSAVQVDGATSYVFVVGRDNVVTRRTVTVGQVTGQGLGISHGLDGTERVVASAGAFLAAGEKVSPVLSASVVSAPVVSAPVVSAAAK